MNTLFCYSKTVRVVVLLFSTLVSTACAVLDYADPKSPTIKVERIRPTSFFGSAQRLEIELLIENPNRFDLPIQSVDFTAFVNREKLAKGASDQFVNVPALGQARIEVQVVLGLEELFSQATRVLTEPDSSVNYSVDGTVSLENWPSAIPFNVDGEYENPLKTP